MQVLVALVRRPGEVVSRDELIATCWSGRIVSDDAINRCIAKARRLGTAYNAFVIETVARVGYRLVSTRTKVCGSSLAPAPSFCCVGDVARRAAARQMTRRSGDELLLSMGWRQKISTPWQNART